MRSGLLHQLQQLLRGQSIARIKMNEAFIGRRIHGRTIDVGGGRSPDYFDYLTQEEGSTVEAIDGSTDDIDFERDSLPYGDGAIDTVLLSNVLEHIYRYDHLLRECARILKSDGRLIGFVPFFVGYHPDPRDYFRYTNEALELMLGDAGLTEVSIIQVGRGPFLAAFNIVSLSFPRLLRPFLYLPFAFLDAVLLSMRPAAGKRAPLGYMFEAMKPHA